MAIQRQLLRTAMVYVQKVTAKPVAKASAKTATKTAAVAKGLQSSTPQKAVAKVVPAGKSKAAVAAKQAKKPAAKGRGGR